MIDTPRPRRALFVVNRRSRHGREAATAAEDTLQIGGLHLLHESCENPDALASAIRRRADSVDLVVLGGGDGTLNAAAPALIETGLPLGILPLGTANDLARTLALPLDPGEAAGVIVAGHSRRIDVGEVNGIPFFNVASLGLSARMARELTHGLKRRWGRFGYAMATARVLSRMRPFTAEIRCGGRIQSVRTLQISVGNGRHYGGGLTVEKSAEIDDGFLDLYSLEFDRPWKLALVYPAFRKGHHDFWKDVRTLSCAEVEIRTVRPRPVNTDGELTTTTPARFRVLRQAISVLAPEVANEK